MDGVLTDTAAVHSAAWKQAFDEFLRTWAQRTGAMFEEFCHARDYRAHVDGRPRHQGVASFLASRGISLPQGSPNDLPRTGTICGLGNRKNELFHAAIAASGAAVYPSTVALIRALHVAGIKVGLATSSRNSELILSRSRTASLFATVVDGLVSERLGLRGKPLPDIFAAASANLGAEPARAVIFEDAVSGVRAGADGGFALVIGVARENNAWELRENGADFVVEDLGGLSVEKIDEQVRLKRAAA
ncbi:MAG: HAD-IA family hydrolase [Opitutae bacterium]|nr:HAD-IA family hydrolase [Opitutae bacterium]